MRVRTSAPRPSQCSPRRTSRGHGTAHLRRSGCCGLSDPSPTGHPSACRSRHYALGCLNPHPQCLRRVGEIGVIQNPQQDHGRASSSRISITPAGLDARSTRKERAAMPTIRRGGGRGFTRARRRSLPSKRRRRRHPLNELGNESLSLF